MRFLSPLVGRSRRDHRGAAARIGRASVGSVPPRAGAGRRRHGGGSWCDHYHRFEEDATMARLGPALSVQHLVGAGDARWPRGRERARWTSIAGFWTRLAGTGSRRMPRSSTGTVPGPRGSVWVVAEPRDGQGFRGVLRRGRRVRLGDRVAHWMTINEIRCFTHMGYGVNETRPHAPGTVLRSRKSCSTVHHARLRTGWAARRSALRHRGVPRLLVDNFDAYVPVIETPEISMRRVAPCGRAAQRLRPRARVDGTL